MKRRYKVLLTIAIIGFTILCLYAFVEPVRAWMQDTLGPPTQQYTSGFVTAVRTNPIWVNYISPFPNQAIIFGAIIYIPLFVLWLRSRTRLRQWVHKGSREDAGFATPVMTEPVSQVVTAAPVAKSTPAPTPTTAPTPTPKPAESSPPPAEEKSEKA